MSYFTHASATRSPSRCSFTDPTLLFTIGYAIVILSPSGLFLGYLWSRTRNLLLVTLAHGSIDLVPNILKVADTLRIRQTFADW